jgi:putative membrane protein insertion efficiency factor
MVKSNIIKKFLKLLSILLIKIYQLFISKLFHQNLCRFTPSCSSYAIEAIEKKGLIKGICYAIYRILRCNPFNKNFGYDPVEKLNENNIDKKSLNKFKK